MFLANYFSEIYWFHILTNSYLIFSVCIINKESDACHHCHSSLPKIAVLITGGSGNNSKSVEAVRGDGKSHCKMPNLPDQRIGHTIDGDILCGGENTKYSCMQFKALNQIKFLLFFFLPVIT